MRLLDDRLLKSWKTVRRFLTGDWGPFDYPVRNAPVRAAADGLLVGWKYLGSFLKRDWSLGAYPVRVEYFPDVLKRWGFKGDELRGDLPGDTVERLLRSPPWSGTWFAHVVNWPQMSSFGDSPTEALGEMREAFAERKASGEPLPRPGIPPPLTDAGAADHRMAEHPELAADFFRRILDSDYRRTLGVRCGGPTVLP